MVHTVCMRQHNVHHTIDPDDKAPYCGYRISAYAHAQNATDTVHRTKGI